MNNIISADPELLAQIAAGLGQTDVASLLPAGGDRRWALALETEAYEAWVIAWPAGTGLDMHDHGGSLASMYVVDGQLRERFLAADGSVNVRWVAAGHTIDMPSDHTHEVINLGDVEAISVHVYSPRLADQSFRTIKAVS